MPGTGFTSFQISFLNGPKLEMFGSSVFSQIRPGWVGDLGARPKNQNFDGLGLKIAIAKKCEKMSATALILSPVGGGAKNI
jgi:hypothetical protein